MHKVLINKELHFADDGVLLSHFLQLSHADIPHPCGGNGSCKKCKVTVNGKAELSCQYKIHSDIVVETNEAHPIYSFLEAEPSHKKTENMCFALDIGTTTLALALVSLDDKKIVEVITDTNPQVVYGADIVSRIDFCTKNGCDTLKTILIEKINAMIEVLGVSSNIELFVSGNATMLHIFLGEDCTSMGQAPYTPAFTASQVRNAGDLGLVGTNRVVTLPCISAFIGADIVAGLNYVETPENNYSLLVDLGTNAEIALFSKEKILCTSAAAGPCFEGASIACGMSAIDGAVFAYEDGEAHTINSKSLKGICGTGLIDIIAELLKKGIIDNSGYMACENFFLSDNVFLNRKDVRQYQLAKSAVSSGIFCLLKAAEISPENIEQLYISGGFSAKINIANAILTGLLPKELKEKCVSISNSSLLGTVKYICEQNDLSHIPAIAEYIDLSENPDFSHKFIENMTF